MNGRRTEFIAAEAPVHALHAVCFAAAVSASVGVPALGAVGCWAAGELWRVRAIPDITAAASATTSVTTCNAHALLDDLLDNGRRGDGGYVGTGAVWLAGCSIMGVHRPYRALWRCFRSSRQARRSHSQTPRR